MQNSPYLNFCSLSLLASSLANVNFKNLSKLFLNYHAFAFAIFNAWKSYFHWIFLLKSTACRERCYVLGKTAVQTIFSSAAHIWLTNILPPRQTACILHLLCFCLWDLFPNWSRLINTSFETRIQLYHACYSPGQCAFNMVIFHNSWFPYETVNLL